MGLTDYGEVLAGPIVGINPLKAVLNALKMVVGIAEAWRFIRRHRPQATLLTGGWANVPVAFASRLAGVPILVYLPDIEPGRTIQLVARFARRVAVTVADSVEHFPGTATVVTGYPLREALLEARPQHERWQLDPKRKTLLVMGGSRGARSINLALEAIVPDLLADGVQILHLTGTLDWERSQVAMASRLRERVNAHDYHAMPYTDEMGFCLAVADLVIARAGASVLGELTHFGIPSILVPYPHAWRYQRTNADYLAARGACLRLDDEQMSERLLPSIRNLLQDEAKYAEMRQAAGALAVADGAGHIAQELLRLGVGQNDG